MIHRQKTSMILRRAIMRVVAWNCLAFAMAVTHAEAQQSPPAQPKLIPLPHPELPKPIITEPGLPLWLVATGAVAALLLVGIIIWLLMHRGRAPEAPKIPPLTRAKQRLKELLTECPTLPPDETGHRVSVIVRDYQEARYSVPAPYRTREELYEKNKLPADDRLRTRFEPLAALCDRLAFAPAPATTSQAEALVQSALDALQDESHHRDLQSSF